MAGRIQQAGGGVVIHCVVEQFGPEPAFTVDRAGIRVEEKLGGVVAQAPSAIVGADDSETVGLALPDAGHEAMPDVAVAFRQRQSGLGSAVVE